MGVFKVAQTFIAKGISTLVGSVSAGHLTVKSGTALTGSVAIAGNLAVSSRFIGVQGLNQGTATIPTGSAYVVITTAAVSSQTAYALSMVTAAASSRLLGLSVDSVVAGTSFAIVSSAVSPEALAVRWKIQG